MYINAFKGALDMWKFSSKNLKWLKMLHIFLIVLFLGGILSSFSLTVNLNLSNFDDVYMTYKSLAIISDKVVQIGGAGTILLGLIYGFFTRWGFIKYRWLAVKWVLFIAQTFVGILVIDRLRAVNSALLETEKVAALSNPIFIHNHNLRQYVVIAQIVFTILALIISVTKPGRNQTSHSKVEKRREVAEQEKAD